MNFTHQRPFCGRVTGFSQEFPRILFQGHFLPCSLWGSEPGPDCRGGRPEAPREGAPASSSTGDPAPGQQHRRPACEVGFTSLMDPLFPFSWGSRGGIWRPARKEAKGEFLFPADPLCRWGPAPRSPASCVQPAGCNQVEGLPLPVSPTMPPSRPWAV